MLGVVVICFWVHQSAGTTWLSRGVGGGRDMRLEMKCCIRVDEMGPFHVGEGRIFGYLLGKCGVGVCGVSVKVANQTFCFFRVQGTCRRRWDSSRETPESPELGLR
jgi:hypothetical protein